MHRAFVIAFCVFVATVGASGSRAESVRDDATVAAQASEKALPEKKDDGRKQQVSEKMVTELRIVPFQKTQKPDSTMPRGTVKVVQPGREGRELVTYLVKMLDGKEVERTAVGVEVLSEPRQHIELIGTAPVLSERMLTELRAIPFQKEQKPDDSLPAGTVKVIEEGREGQERITYRVKLVDGKETERIVVNSEVLSPPVTRIEVVGTGKVVQEQPIQEPSPTPSLPPRKEEK